VITVQVTDTVAITLITIKVVYPGQAAIAEVVFDGMNFGPSFQGHANAQTLISGGYQFTILRDGGWPVAPLLTTTVADATGSRLSS
jgi:hypothetical protein